MTSVSDLCTIYNQISPLQRLLSPSQSSMFSTSFMGKDPSLLHHSSPLCLFLFTRFSLPNRSAVVSSCGLTGGRLSPSPPLSSLEISSLIRSLSIFPPPPIRDIQGEKREGNRMEQKSEGSCQLLRTSDGSHFVTFLPYSTSTRS